MFDGKTVTAVFVSLAVIAVLTSGQQLNAPNLEGGGDFNLESLLPSGGEVAFENRPAPNKTVDADFTADLSDETLQVYNTNITSQGLDSVESIGLNSEQTITLTEFTGTVHLKGENVTLTGDAEGYSTSGVNVEQSFQINDTHTTSGLTLETVKFQHTFNQTEGDIEGPSGQNSETADTVNFNSFTGKVVFDLQDQSVQLDGEVDRLESGSFVIN